MSLDEPAGQRRERGNVTEIGGHDHHVTSLQETHSATRSLLKSTTHPLPCENPPSIIHFTTHSPSNLMPLVRSQEDELHHIESDLDPTTVAKWRVSTPYSRRSYGLRSSLKPPSCNPRFLEKATSCTTAVHHVVRLERIQEDEDDDGYPTQQPRLSQMPMEANVSGFWYVYHPGLLMYAPGSDR